MAQSATITDLPARFFQAQERLQGLLAGDLCTLDYSASIAGFPAMDRAGHGEFGRAFYAGFPDLRHTVEETIADGDDIAVRFTIRGTHTGAFMGLPPTGRIIEVNAQAFMTIEHGRVRRLRGVFDRFGMMQQLGKLLPV